MPQAEACIADKRRVPGLNASALCCFPRARDWYRVLGLRRAGPPQDRSRVCYFADTLAQKTPSPKGFEARRFRWSFRKKPCCCSRRDRGELPAGGSTDRTYSSLSWNMPLDTRPGDMGARLTGPALSATGGTVTRSTTRPASGSSRNRLARLADAIMLYYALANRPVSSRRDWIAGALFRANAISIRPHPTGSRRWGRRSEPGAVPSDANCTGTGAVRRPSAPVASAAC